jgi:hypothetical protein
MMLTMFFVSLPLSIWIARRVTGVDPLGELFKLRHAIVGISRLASVEANGGAWPHAEFAWHMVEAYAPKAALIFGR